MCAALTPLLERTRIEANESTDFHDRNADALPPAGIGQRRRGYLEKARGFGNAEQPDVVSQVDPEPFPGRTTAPGRMSRSFDRSTWLLPEEKPDEARPDDSTNGYRSWG